MFISDQNEKRLYFYKMNERENFTLKKKNNSGEFNSMFKRNLSINNAYTFK